MNAYKDTLYQDKFGEIIETGYIDDAGIAQCDAIYLHVSSFLDEKDYPVSIIIDGIIPELSIIQDWNVTYNHRTTWDYANQITYVINLENTL